MRSSATPAAEPATGETVGADAEAVSARVVALAGSGTARTGFVAERVLTGHPDHELMDGFALWFAARTVVLFGACAVAEFVAGNAELVPPVPLVADLLAFAYFAVMMACGQLLVFGVA